VFFGDEMQSPLNSNIVAELKDLMGEDYPFLIDTFTVDSRSRLESLKTFVDNHDLESIKSSAHSLKGSSANIGAIGMEVLCQELVTMTAEQSSAQDKNTNDFRSVYVKLHAEYYSVLAALAEYS